MIEIAFYEEHSDSPLVIYGDHTTYDVNLMLKIDICGANLKSFQPTGISITNHAAVLYRNAFSPQALGNP